MKIGVQETSSQYLISINLDPTALFKKSRFDLAKFRDWIAEARKGFLICSKYFIEWRIDKLKYQKPFTKSLLDFFCDVNQRELSRDVM